MARPAERRTAHLGRRKRGLRAERLPAPLAEHREALLVVNRRALPDAHLAGRLVYRRTVRRGRRKRHPPGEGQPHHLAGHRTDRRASSRQYSCMG